MIHLQYKLYNMNFYAQINYIKQLHYRYFCTFTQLRTSTICFLHFGPSLRTLSYMEAYNNNMLAKVLSRLG